MLTDAALKCLKPKAKMYKVTDRDGMYVRVAPTGGISFRLDYRLNGRRETVHLGKYARDGISLARARELCLDAKRMIAEGLSDRNWTEIAQQLTAFIREHRRAVTHLFHSSQRDLLEDYIYDVTYAVTESLVRRTAAGLPVSEEDLHTVTMYFTSALLGMISRWLRFGLKDNAEQTVERTGYLLEGSLRRMLERSCETGGDA